MDSNKKDYSIQLYFIVILLGVIAWKLFDINNTISEIYSDTHWITGFLEINLTR